LGTPNPVYTYTDDGLYSVTLVMTDTCGTAVATTIVEVLCDAPVGDFVSNSPVMFGQPLHFTASITGTEPLTYTWDFGGAGSGTELGTATPVYTYTNPGAYTVTLTADNPCGPLVVVHPVEVQCDLPVGDFVSDSPVMLGQPMYFTASITGTEPLTYTWDFGGAGSGTGLGTLTPIYTYTDPGVYTVTLTVDDVCGQVVIPNAVEVQCDSPEGGFTSSSPVTLGQPMAFTATVTGTGPLTYSWDLGDGVGWSDLPNVVYTYTTSGEFTVTLTVGGPCGAATFTDTVLVEAALHRIYLPLVIH